ncbi:MAG: class II aldolase/adducin family protein [Chloroflexi bacterium]|nr:class II aldolase/adducin family protein [Chloroflexota bacterium]
MGNVDQLKESLAMASRILANEGLSSGFGHISVRIPGTDRFLIPRSMSPALVQPEDILMFDLSGKKLEGEQQANSETWIHTCVYRVRSDVGCVSHVHPPMTTSIASAGKEIRPLHNFGSLFPDGVRLFWKPGLINTEALGIEMAEALGQDNAILLRGHGATVVGPRIKDAVLWSIYLEEAAQIQFNAMLLGSTPFYTREEALMIKEQVYSGRSVEKGWEYYVEKLAKVEGRA